MKPPLDYNIEPYLVWILNCQIGDISAIRKMLESGYDINTRDDDGYSGLYHSLEEEEYGTSFHLIDYGIEVTEIDLKKACNKENRELVERIITELNQKGKEGIEEAFMDFVYLCSYEFLVWYVKKFNPNVNYVGSHQLTAISEVATNGDLKKFKFLLQCGSDINLRANNGLNTIEWCNEVIENEGVTEIIKEIKTATNNGKENIGQIRISARFVHLANFGFGGQAITSKALRFLAEPLYAMCPAQVWRANSLGFSSFQYQFLVSKIKP